MKSMVMPSKALGRFFCMRASATDELFAAAKRDLNGSNHKGKTHVYFASAHAWKCLGKGSENFLL